MKKPKKKKKKEWWWFCGVYMVGKSISILWMDTRKLKFIWCPNYLLPSRLVECVTSLKKHFPSQKKNSVIFIAHLLLLVYMSIMCIFFAFQIYEEKEKRRWGKTTEILIHDFLCTTTIRPNPNKFTNITRSFMLWVWNHHSNNRNWLTPDFSNAT